MKLNVGPTLRMLRRQKKTKTVVVARAVGVAPQVIDHWESGRAAPGVDQFFLLCKALDVDPKAVWRAARRTHKGLVETKESGRTAEG